MPGGVYPLGGGVYLSQSGQCTPPPLSIGYAVAELPLAHKLEEGQGGTVFFSTSRAVGSRVGGLWSRRVVGGNEGWNQETGIYMRGSIAKAVPSYDSCVVE